MLSRTLRSGLSITELGFGAAQLGNLFRETTDDEAQAAVEAAWDAGIRYFDTAPHYGLGLSERRLGAALAARPRDEYVISTKVGRLIVPSGLPTAASTTRASSFPQPPDGSGTSAATVSAGRSTRASSDSDSFASISPTSTIPTTTGRRRTPRPSRR